MWSILSADPNKARFFSGLSIYCGWAGILILVALIMISIRIEIITSIGIAMLITSLSLMVIAIAFAAITKGIKRKTEMALRPMTHENWGLYPSAVILLLTATIAAPNLYHARLYDKSRKTLALMADYSHALERYYDAHGLFPSPGHSGALATLDSSDGKPLPTTNEWGDEFFYSCSADGETYILVSPGCDGHINRQYSLDPLPELKRFDDVCEDFVMVNGDFFQAYSGWCYHDSNYQHHLDLHALKIANIEFSSNTSNHETLLKKAKLEMAVGKHEEAVHSLRIFNERNPEDLPAKTLLCESLYRIGLYEETLLTCTEIIREDHAIGAAWYFRGLSKYGLGSKRQALDDFKRAAAIDKDWAYQVQFDLKRFEEDNFVRLRFTGKILGIEKELYSLKE